MNETMGQIIRKLRKEKNLTQEDLAMQLGITYQAVSKWENGAGMPDISQVVPLAHIFGVSTDVLFGIAGMNHRHEVMKIIKNAQSLLSRPLCAADLLKKYTALQKGLEVYPNDPLLLIHCLETGMCLSYPENTVYDAKNAKRIYEECIYYANLVVSYSPNTTDVLRAHMIMVLLHSANGDFKQAKAHTEQFPWRADLNLHVMYAYYAHWQKDYETEALSCRYGVAYYLDALLNILLHLGQAYDRMGQTENAIDALENALLLIDCLFKNEDAPPPVHQREQGDLYKILAQLYLKKGDAGAALSYLSKMVDYDLFVYEKLQKDTVCRSPLFHDTEKFFYQKPIDRHSRLRAKLEDACFSSLFETEGYRVLLAKVKA